MISKEKADLVVEKIRESVKPEQIYLFGSYVSGKAGENSDLDVCIIKDNVQDKHKELFKAKSALFKIGIPLDILMFDSKMFSKRKNIWGSVQYEIFHNGVKAYEK